MEPALAEIRVLTSSGRGRRTLRAPNPEVRQRLLAAAHQLIDDRGDAGLRIDEVADRAGVSVGTLYLYFDGKDGLLTAMVVGLVEELCEAPCQPPPLPTRAAQNQQRRCQLIVARICVRRSLTAALFVTAPPTARHH